MPHASNSQQVADASADEALVAAIRNAEEHAFGVLYERYFQRVYLFSLLRLRDHADAEEAAQETFTSVFRSLDAYRGESSLVSWIYGIARNTVNNQLRRANARRRRMARARIEWVRTSLLMSPRTPEDELNLQRSIDQVRDCLASVSDWQAEIFALRHLENLPIEEIARRVSRSSDSVRSSLYRVKSLLVNAVGPGDPSPKLGRVLDGRPASA
ncbi:MAG: sigma-70 family RNA polymerase sigma factor [Deltaproteobacteria bacterium]|nr:sigma-70 family RNA polymerase sigma factor [Deltaproteobacteria bacterium]MBW2694372.1 sigma-70 family RNA polymerase sigma factor [Deltaproteobacteria bacterium]